MIKVLQVLGSLNLGGAESRMMDIYRHIDKERIQFDFLTMKLDKQYFEEEINSMGGKIIKIPPPRETGILSNMKRIYKTIKEHGLYDAIHAHTSFHCGVVMLIAFLAGVPVRISHARTTNTKNKGFKSSLMILINKFMLKLFSTERLAVSNKAATFLFGKNKNNVSILPNAIDTDKYFKGYGDVAERMEEVKNRSTIIGHVGRFEYIKNHVFLIKLLKEYVKNKPDVLLMLIGDGPERKNIEELVKENDLQRNVKFMGIRDDVNIWMNIFDVFILPSFYEGLCGVAIEAQAAGTPCILSSGITTEVDLGLGLIKFIPLDAEMEIWIKAIDEQISKQHPSNEFIKNKFEEKHYSLQYVIERLLLIYRGSKKNENTWNNNNNI